jgi:hypothetical protein
MKATGLIIGGKVVPCDKPVFNWNDHGLAFKPGDGARKRLAKQTIDMFIWHWTGGNGTYQGLYNVLDQRDLGVEFYIGNGMICQFADPLLVDTYDAGPFNPRSVGCEIRNYGYTDWDRPLPAAFKERQTYETKMNGRTRKFARFHEDEIQCAIALGDAVSAAIPSIPRAVPAAGGKLYPDTMSRTALSKFKGHLGHYHLTDNKSDPGHDLLQRMLDAGYSASPV